MLDTACESHCQRCWDALNAEEESYATAAGEICGDCHEELKLATFDAQLRQPVVIWRPEPALVQVTQLEPVYKVNEAAQVLKLSANAVRKLFRNEPGVIDLAGKPAGKKLGKKRHKAQLRIPESVLRRVQLRRSK